MVTKSSHKIACLTGATDGIGKQVALGLARQGYDLVVIARNPAKGELLAQEVRKIAPSSDLTFIPADLTLVADAKKAIQEIHDRFPVIDILFQSAGIIPRVRQLTKEGIEQSFAVSFLTRFLLTQSLLPNVLASMDKLILTIASPQPGGNHAIRFDDINLQSESFSSNATVRQFQEANDVYALELGMTNAIKGLRNYCINPGIVNTGIHAGWPPLLRFFLTKVVGLFLMVEPEQSAQMILSFVTGQNKEQGPLIGNKGKTVTPVSRVLDATYRKRLIELAKGYTEGTA